MPQIQELAGVPSFGGQLGLSLGQGISQGLQKQIESYQKGKAFERAGLPRALAYLDPTVASQMIKNVQKNAMIQQILGGQQPETQGVEQRGQSQDQIDQSQIGEERNALESQKMQPKSISAPTQGAGLTPKQRIALTAAEPTLGRAAQTEEKLATQKFEHERAYHGKYAEPAEKKVSGLRESLPKKESALRFAREAIESGEVGQFSKSAFAELPFLPTPLKKALLTGKAAELSTAAKENLLSNMTRVSSKAQNQWFEQRLNSMFPQIGQSEEANLTIQEMLEGEVALDEAYLKEFDKLSAEDEARYGYTRKDIEKRTHEALKPIEKQILDRTSYRIKEIDEAEKGEGKLKNQLGKKVIKGTPLTVRMGNLMHKKYGEKTLEIAEKLGYKIPTAEEYEAFSARPEEFREMR